MFNRSRAWGNGVGKEILERVTPELGFKETRKEKKRGGGTRKHCIQIIYVHPTKTNFVIAK